MDEVDSATMRKGQITLFIILGLVLLISIIILFLARSALIQGPTQEITADETLTRTCLVRVTDISLAALTDDGVIRQEQGGPLPGEYGDHTYLFHRTKDQLAQEGHTFYGTNQGAPIPRGTMNYTGLCDVAGFNALNMFAPRRYSCNSQVYHYATHPSVQQQLEISITNHMRSCLGQELGTEEVAGNAEVVIQDQGLVIRWTDPLVQHSPRTPLQGVWRAIKYTLDQETSNNTFSPNRRENNAYPDRELTCTGCGAVEFLDVTGNETLEIPEKSPDFPYNVWQYSVGGEVYARILLENRNIGFDDEINGYLFINEPTETDQTPHVELQGELTEQVTLETLGEIKASFPPLYTFDDDPLNITDRNQFAPTEHECYYALPDEDDPIPAPCWPRIESVYKHQDETSFSPHINYFNVTAGCNADAPTVTVEDLGGNTLVVQLRVPHLSNITYTYQDDDGDDHTVDISCTCAAGVCNQ